MKKYRFYDLQTCAYSAHNSLKELTEMLLADAEKEVKPNKEDIELLEKCRNGEMTEKEMKTIIEKYGYEVEDVKMIKYRLINYFDVWGNEVDGWEVNNLCEEGVLEIEENANNEELIEALKDFGFFNDNANINTVEVWNDFEMIEFFDKKTHCPLCRLELIQ